MIGSNFHDKNELKVLSLHWGFSIGGIGKYAAMIEGVKKYQPIFLQSVCILGKKWQCDYSTLEKIRAKKIIINSRGDISWLWKVVRDIDRIKPDLIMTHGFNGHFVCLASRPFRKHNPAVICSYHGDSSPTSLERKILEGIFNRMTERFIRHYAMAVAVVAEYTEKYLVRKGVSPRKITVIHNGIGPAGSSANVRENLRNEWGVKEGEILVGTASRVDEVKGIPYLIEAIVKVSRQINNIRVVIVGTGRLEDTLKKRVEKLGLRNKVLFAGFRTDIDDCLEAFDIFALPSLAEYHSIALLEAMRSGKAIVSTDVGGNTESVRHEKEALIVPAANADKLAESIERLARDSTLRKELGNAARKRCLENFTLDEMIRKTANWMIRCGNLARTKNEYRSHRI